MDDQEFHFAEGSPIQTWTGAPCPHCGSRDIVTGLRYNLNAEVGPLGLSYKAFGPFGGTEQLYAELCRGCGTVVRTFVKNTNRKWIQK